MRSSGQTRRKPTKAAGSASASSRLHAVAQLNFRRGLCVHNDELDEGSAVSVPLSARDVRGERIRLPGKEKVLSRWLRR